MNPVGWWIAANTAVTSGALILAVIAVWKAAGWMRQCRCVVQAYAPLAAKQADSGERLSALLADRITERTAPFEPVLDDEPPTGRHARPEPTEVLPATGRLTDLPPAYYFDSAKGAVSR